MLLTGFGLSGYKDKKIWALIDDRAGNTSQVIGVAESLSLPYEKKNISYNSLVKFPNFIRGKSLVGVDIKNSSNLFDESPDVIIGAGRRILPVSRFLKKSSGDKAFIVQIMGADLYKDIDLFFLPEHDKDLESEKRFSKVIFTIGSPNRVNKDFLSKEKSKWSLKFSDLSKPLFAMLLGGTTKYGEFTDKHALILADKLNHFMKDIEGTLLITTSRRTPESVINKLVSNLEINYYLYDYKDGESNPYYGYLSVSDSLIVTGDSVSMCSEACSTGKPVYIYSPSDITPLKFQSFHNNLYRDGYAKPLEGIFESWSYTPLNESKKIASYINKHCFNSC